MNSYMNFQVGSLREGFIATVVRASEGLGTIMQVIVSFKSAFSREVFVAIRKSAFKSNIFFVLIEAQRWIITV